MVPLPSPAVDVVSVYTGVVLNVAVTVQFAAGIVPEITLPETVPPHPDRLVKVPVTAVAVQETGVPAG